MKRQATSMLALAVLAALTPRARAGIVLGSAGDFAVLAGTTVSNTGASTVNGGDVGVDPGSTITGFPPGTVGSSFTMHEADAMALQGQTDLASAYTAAGALTPTQTVSGGSLGGLTLTPGVYSFSSAATLSGALRLDDEGNPDAQFVFQIPSNLTIADDATITTLNGDATSGNNVFWQVGGSATLGTDSSFEGNILALSNITLSSGASIYDGSALAETGSVTLDDSSIDANTTATGAVAAGLPAPALTGGLLLLATGAFARKRKRPLDTGAA